MFKSGNLASQLIKINCVRQNKIGEFKKVNTLPPDNYKHHEVLAKPECDYVVYNLFRRHYVLRRDYAEEGPMSKHNHPVIR